MKMRLLQLQANGKISLARDLIEHVPPYAILSHTWGSDEEEVTFSDLRAGVGRKKAGFQKIRFCGEQAARDGLHYFWVDTCCIDKSNSTELAEAINSMFRWYQNATRCYVWLADVPVTPIAPWEEAFRRSRWFTRGWTLQELIAPSSVEFFSPDGRLGDKRSLEREIHRITGIPVSALRGSALSMFTIKERMAWAEKRTTRRAEDKAYSLLGIFGICVPLIYGEGTENAFRRLQEEVDRVTRFNIGNAKRHRGMVNEDLASLVTSQQRIKTQVAGIVNTLRTQGLAIDIDDSEDVTVIVGSTAEASLTLSFISRFMSELYRAYSVHHKIEASRSYNAQWLQDQFKRIWADVQEQSATELRNSKRRKLLSRKRKSNHSLSAEATNVPRIMHQELQRNVGEKLTSIIRKRKLPMESSSFEVSLPIGQVKLHFVSGQHSKKLLGLRLVYAPVRNLQLNVKGIVMACMKDQRPQPIARCLSTFHVHSEDSEVVQSIQSGNLEAVHQLLSMRRFLPNDRDEDGDSLLMVSLVERRFEVSKLLLEEGANPLDCDSTGNSVLCCFLDEIFGLAGMVSEDPSTNVDTEATNFALRLFVQYCGPDTGVALKHYTDLGQSVGESFVPAIQYAMNIVPDSDVQTLLFQPVRRLLTSECDLEEVDGFGRSALLASVEGVKRSHLAEMVDLLLQFGASPHAVDNGDAGILHYILRTTSACNRAHTRQAIFQSIRDIVVKLLLRGCNPNAVDENDLTPSDLALSSSAWLLWCDALEAAGLAPDGVLRDDDRIHNVVLDNALLDRKYSEWLEFLPPRWQVVSDEPSQPEQGLPVCSYCQFPDEWTQTRAPFDHNGTYLVQMGSSFTHASFVNHTDGSSCGNGRKPMSCRRKCHKKDGGFAYWSWKSLSIRKHIAYRLWKDRVLANPAQAYTWATGSLNDSGAS